MRLIRWFLRQHDIGAWLGGLKDIYGRALAYQSITNIFLIALTTYNTLKLREEEIGSMEWLSLPVFFGAIFLLLIISMVLVYKFELPSMFHYSQDQVWKHYNPLRDYLFEIGEKLEELSKKIEEMKRKEGG